MRFTERPKFKVRGMLEVQCVAPDGRILKRIRVPNTITYKMYDTMAKAIVGEAGYKATHIYTEHADVTESGYVEGSLNGLTASKLDDLDTMNTFPRTVTGAKLPLLQKTFSETLEWPEGNPIDYYSSNIITLNAVMSNVELNDRIFVAAGVVMQKGADEVVLARTIHPGIIKTSAFDLVYFWSISFISND